MRRIYCPTFHGFIVRFRMLIAGIALALLSMFLALPALPQTKLIAVGGGSSGGGSGTVTNIGVTVPSFMNVTPASTTTSATFDFTFDTQAQGLIFASPCSGSGAVTFRALCAADIPALDPSKITGTAVIDSDIRLTNARTPTAHASTHAAAGSDAVTLTQAQVTNLVSDLAGKQATGDYITALTGDVVASGPGSATATIQANSVALGTDTTGNYAGSSSEGGSATSLADAANIDTGTISAARLPALSGDVTTSAGSAVTDLSDVNANVGTFGDATTVPVITVDAEGRISAVTTATVTAGVACSSCSANTFVKYNGTALVNTGLTETGSGASKQIAVDQGQFATAVGSAARPALILDAANWDTGFFSPSANVWQFVRGGVDQFTLNNGFNRYKSTFGLVWSAGASTAAGDLQLGRGTAAGVLTVGTSGIGATDGQVATGGYVASIVTKTANYTATKYDNTILGDTTTATFTITLPACASNAGLTYNVKKTVAANTLTIDGNASETIDAATTLDLTTINSARTIQCNGTSWFVIAGYLLP